MVGHGECTNMLVCAGICVDVRVYSHLRGYTCDRIITEGNNLHHMAFSTEMLFATLPSHTHSPYTDAKLDTEGRVVVPEVVATAGSHLFPSADDVVAAINTEQGRCQVIGMYLSVR